jgi:hypothetical protein
LGRLEVGRIELLELPPENDMIVALECREDLAVGLGDLGMGLPEDILGILLERSTDVGPDCFDAGEAVAGPLG